MPDERMINNSNKNADCMKFPANNLYCKSMKTSIIRHGLFYQLALLSLLVILLYWVSPVQAGQTGEEKVNYLCINSGYEFRNPDFRVANAMRYLPLNKEFSVSFSMDIDYNTVNFDSIELIDKESGERAGLSFDKLNGKEVKIIPQAAAIQNGKSYYLIIHNTIKNWDGSQALKRGVIQEIAVGYAGNFFKVQNVNFISSNEVLIRFNDYLDIVSATNLENYAVNGDKPESIRVLADGKSVCLKLKTGGGNTNLVLIKNTVENIYKYKMAAAVSKSVYLFTASGTSSINNYSGSADILAESVILQNATVTGDVYVSRNKATLRNLQVSGTVFIDPGITGSIILDNVNASHIEILSGKDETITLNHVQADDLLIKSRSKVRIMASNVTWIGTTSVEFLDDDVILELSSNSVCDSVEISNSSLSPNQLELIGAFANVNIYAPATVLCSNAASIQNMIIQLNQRESVIIDSSGTAGIHTMNITKPVIISIDNVAVDRVDIQTNDSNRVDLTLGSKSVVNRLTSILTAYPNLTLIPGAKLTRDPITNLTSAGCTQTTASLTWTVPNDATAQKIQQSPGGSAAVNWTNSTVQTPLTASSAQAVVTGLTAQTIYKFKLVVTGGPNEGDSNVVQLTTSVTTDFGDAVLAAGSALGASSISWGTALPAGATKVMYKVIPAAATYTFPGLDEVFAGGTDAVKGADITGINIVVGNQVVIAATDADNQIKAYKVISLSIDNIKQTVSANISGTLISGNESDIVSGGKTIIITLAYGEWVAEVAINAAIRNALFDGLAAPGAESAEWQKLVDALKAAGTGTVARSSATQLTITLPSITTYNISTDQTINLTIPAAAISGATIPLAAANDIKIAANTTAAITGSVISAPPGEADILAGGKSIIVTLSNGKWATDVISSTAKLNGLYDGFKANGTEAIQWAKVITALKASGAGAITRNSDIQLTIILPSTDGYNITINQPVILTIPGNTLTQSALPTNVTGVVAAPAFQIASSVTAAISGTVTEPCNESNIVAGGKTMIVTLTGGQWENEIASDITRRNALFDGLVTTSDIPECSKVITALKSAGAAAITRVSNSQITIILPSTATYNINSEQTINLSIPISSISGAITTITISPAFKVSTSASAAITGSVIPGPIIESEIVSGGKNIFVTLTDGQWAADIVTDANKRNSLFQGLVASGTESAQWIQVVNALKNDGLGSITRVSGTEILISLPETPGYNIRSNQTVSLTIPASAIVGASSAVVAGPSLQILAIPSATLSGTILSSCNENSINDGGKTIIITLTDGQWASDIASDMTKRNALFDGLATSTENGEWAKVITALKTAGLSAITLNSVTQVTITLPAVPLYNINGRQTIVLTIPVSDLIGAGSSVIATPYIQVAAVANLAGTAISTACSESDIVAGGKYIEVTLTDGQWAADIATDLSKCYALFDGLTAGSETAEWAKVIAALRLDGLGAVNRNSNILLTISLPETSGYDIIANQSISLTIPASAVVGVTGPVASRPSVQIASIPKAVLTGTTVPNCSEADIAAGGKTIIVTLTDGRWTIDVATDPGKRNALFNGLNVAPAGEAAEWAEVVNALIAAGEASLTRNSSTKLTIKLPPVSGYNISSNQNITLIIPAGDLIGAVGSVTATPVIQILGS